MTTTRKERRMVVYAVQDTSRRIDEFYCLSSEQIYDFYESGDSRRSLAATLRKLRKSSRFREEFHFKVQRRIQQACDQPRRYRLTPSRR